MEQKKIPHRCELVNTRRKSKNIFRRVFASLQHPFAVMAKKGGRVVCFFLGWVGGHRNSKRSAPCILRRVFGVLQRFVFYFLNVGGFARSFRLVGDAFRSFRRLWLVVAFFSSLPAFSAGVPTASELEAAMLRMDANITNLQDSVAILSQQVAALQATLGASGGGGGLAGDVSSFSDSFDEFVALWTRVVGATGPSNRSFSWAIGSILNQVTTMNTKSTNIAASLSSISNVVSSLDFESLTFSVQSIEQLVGYIYMDISEIKYLLQDMLDMQYNWSDVHTNLLNEILEKIQVIVNITNMVYGGGGGDGGDDGGGGAIQVRVDGDAQVDWEYNWSFDGTFLDYIEHSAGFSEWQPNFINTRQADLSVSGRDYREGVIQGFKNLAKLQIEQLEGTHRILLCLQGTNDLSDIKRDMDSRKDEITEQIDDAGRQMDEVSEEFQSHSWSSRFEEAIDTAFTPFRDFTLDSSDNVVVFTFAGGEFLGFDWETFQIDCSDVLTAEVSEFIRAWVIFFFYGSLVFLALRLFPIGLARFATIVYFLSSINRNTGG